MKSPKAQEHHDGIAQEPETPTEAARDDAGPRKTYKTLRFEGFFAAIPHLYSCQLSYGRQSTWKSTLRNSLQ